MKKKGKRLIALLLCFILAIPSSITVFGATADTSDTSTSGGNWSETVLGASNYITNADGTISANCAEVGYDVVNLEDDDCFYLSDDYITQGDYSISFTTKGTAGFPNTKQTKIGVVPYYEDANNYLVVYCDWSETEHENELRCIQFTGVIDGAHYGWNDYWTTDKAIPPSAELSFQVSIDRNTDGTSTLTWSVGADDDLFTRSYTVNATLVDGGKVGLFAAYDTVQFTNIEINATERRIAEKIVSDNTAMAAIEEVSTLGSNFYVTDKYTTDGDYTVSVDMTGTRTLPINPATDSVKMGIVPYYIDDNNFIVVYMDWGLSTNRPSEIRSIQIAGMLDGSFLGWQDIWCDGLAYAPSGDFRMIVQKTDTTSGVKFSVELRAGETTIKSGAREFTKTLAANGKIGVFSSNDSVIFRNFTVTGEGNTAEDLVGWHGTDKTGGLHYTLSSSVELNGYSITLGGTIGLNFFFTFDDAIIEDTNAKVRLTHHKGKKLLVYDYSLADADFTNQGYKFTCEVAAKEMADVITAQVYSDTIPISELWTYSIQSYAEAVINNAEGMYTSNAIDLAKATINYGAYAQAHFKYNVDNLANSSLSEEDKSVEWVTVDHLEPYAKTAKYIDEAIGEISGADLVLKSETILRMYFTLKKDVADLTFTVNGTEIESTPIGNYTSVVIQGLLPQNLGEDYVVAITDGENTLTAEYSALSYCYNVLNREANRSKELVDVVQALYAYYDSASNYLGTSTGDQELLAGDYKVTFKNNKARVGVWGNLDTFTFENFTVEGDNIEDVLSAEYGWTNTSGATNYTENEGIITFDGANTGAINTIAENTIASNFFLSNEYVVEGDYSISVDVTGTKELPINPESDSVMAGIVPYYVDDDNFIVAYVLWGQDVSGDRANDIRSIEVTGVINGNFIGWNTIWCDGVEHAPSHELNLTVNKKDTSSGTEISVALSCIECDMPDAKTASATLAYVLTGNNYEVNLAVNKPRVGVWGNLDTFTFENFTMDGGNIEDVSSAEYGWTNTSGATNYTENEGIITFDGANTGAINTIAENTIASNFFLSNEYVAEGDYSISVDVTGTKELPINPSTDSVMAGIVPYYVDDDNFIVAYVLWGQDVSGDRANDIRSIEVTGVMNGNFIDWNTIWCDDVEHAPSHKLNLTVNKKDTSSGTEISVALSCKTCGVTDAKTGSKTLAYVLTDSAAATSTDTTFQQKQMAQIKVLGSDGVDTYYGNTYSSVTKRANGYLAEAKVVSKNGSLFKVEDLWYVTDNKVVGVDREVKVLKAGTGDSGYASIVTLKNAENATSATDYEYFIPSIIYKDTSDMAAGAIASDLSSDMIYVKETRTGLPMVMARNKTSGNGLALMHLEPEILAGSLVGGGGAGDVNNAIQYGSVGILRQPEVSLSFVYPCTETPTAYDGQVGGRYHTITAGNTHTYKVGLIATQSDSYTDAMVDSYKTAYQAETRYVANIDMGTIYNQNVELLNGVYHEFSNGSTRVWAGLPWSISLSTGEPNAKYPYSAQMGFAGQQTQLGHQMYQYGSRVNDTTTKQKGINILDSWCKSSIHSTYFPAVWWYPDYSSAGGIQTADISRFLRTMVDGMESMLDACVYAKSIGDTSTSATWDKYVQKFGTNLVNKQNSDGSFYRLYNADGSVCTDTSDIRYQGTSTLNTPIAVRFLAKMYEYTGETKYRDAAIKAAEYSYNELYVNKGKYVGGTPDNPNTVDKEAAVYAMYAFTSAYQLTGDEKYKKAAEHAAVSAMSWTYVYDFAVPSGSVDAAKVNPFKDGGVSGFSVIATGHSGADNYSAYAFFEMFKMYVLTGDSFYQNAALLLENNTKLCTDYDGRIDYKYKALMPEATNVADFDFSQSVGSWLPWSTAANMQPISELNNAFGSMDLDAIAGNDLAALKAQLEEYGCGGK